jgi:imidazolonepropionase-like amidohydrolase
MPELDFIIEAQLALVGADLQELSDPMLGVKDGRIVLIGPRDGQEPKAGVKVFRFPGCTVMPGLWNLHVHIQRRHLARSEGTTFRGGAAEVENQPPALKAIYAAVNAKAELNSGVTTIRDCSSGDHISMHLRRAVEAGMLSGPRVISCGMGIASTGGHETHMYKGAVEADGPDEVAKAVRNEIKLGADFIKLMASGGLGGFPDRESPRRVEMTDVELAAAISQAHARDRSVTAHAMGEASIRACINAGIDGIEHGVELTSELAAMMKQRNVYFVPTASGVSAVVERMRSAGKTQASEYLHEHVVQAQRRSIRTAMDSGVLIGAGTDTLGDIVREVVTFGELGMDRRDALKTATSNAALICRRGDRTGQLSPGFDADILVAGNSPLEDLNHLRRVAAVFIGGHIVVGDSAWKSERE